MGLRGHVDPQSGLFSYFSVEERIPADHPLRRVSENIIRAQQAIAVPKANTAALVYLTGYLSEIKKAGLIAASIEKTGVVGASVAP